MNVRSLRFRLAVWYFCTVAAIFSLAATGYWFAIRSSLNTALDQGLRYRMEGLQQYLAAADAEGHGDVASKFADIYHFGELYQVFDDRGVLVAQSSHLLLRKSQPQPPRDVGNAIRFQDFEGTAELNNAPLRVAWQKVTIGGRSFTLGAAEGRRKYEGVLTGLTSVLLLSAVPILCLATICGLWLGRRALAPVARIADDARAITESNLSARLAVPDSRDELQQLSETLNEMLGRIEQSFVRTRQFTADASHELRAPMTLIYTVAQSALRRPRRREELVESLQKVLRESRRTAALIDDLLLLARGDAGWETNELDVLDVRTLVRDAAEQAATMGEAKQVRVTLDVDPEELPVRACEVKLRRLLLILVDNAVKFTPTRGTVTLRARRDGGEVAISVADTGVGMAADDLPHIFERFWRADKVRSRQVRGTGLGLPIAKQIVEQHGASLDVRSEPGRGSLFILRMPKVLVSDRMVTVA